MVDPLDYWQAGIPKQLGLFGGGEENNAPYPVGNDPSFEWVGTQIPYHQYSREGNAAGRAAEYFVKIMGRTPSQAEIAQMTPIFMGSDPNITDDAAGVAWISSLYNSPDEAYKRQQSQYAQGAPEQYGAVDEQFQSLLGRAATTEEKDHFGKFLASGQVDKFQLQEFLKQQPEYLTKQNEAFTSGLSTKLQGYDEQYYREQVMPAIQSTFAKQGRTVESSGFANALAQSAGQQNIERQKYLAGLSAQQYGGVQDKAYQDYANFVQSTQSRQAASLTAPYARQVQLQDFSIQQNAYENYLRRYGKRNGTGAAGIGTLAGAGIGALGAGLATGGMGAGQGALLGAQLGGMGGNLYDYYNY